MAQLGRKMGNASLTKRTLFSFGFDDAIGAAGARIFFPFLAAAAGEAAITAMRAASANFFMVLIPCYARLFGGDTAPSIA